LVVNTSGCSAHSSIRKEKNSSGSIHGDRSAMGDLLLKAPAGITKSNSPVSRCLRNSATSLRKQELMPEACGMNYRLTFGTPPKLFWELENLLAVLKLSYALLITDPANPLKICKNCVEAYYNPNSRSEFCSVKCRNHYNVRAFWERNKENRRIA
jgi:hypothetical protein